MPSWDEEPPPEDLTQLPGSGTQADYLDLPATPMPSLDRVTAPPVADRYDVQGEMARGGLGRIMRAWDRLLDRPVALKELLRPHARGVTRFGREARITARLEHPGIIPVHDTGEYESGLPWFAMKLISGQSLEQAIDARETLVERLGLLPNVIDACEAMAYAHSCGVIHRDLKPDNVLVGPFGETVVIDWGLAKDVGEQEPEADLPESGSTSSGSLTRAGAVMGTPSYMAPEQAAGRELDARADVYALGAILYRLLAGTPPYADGDTTRIVERVLVGPPVDVDDLEPGVPRDLLAVVRKAMARDALDRYPDAASLSEELNRFQTGQIVGAYHYSATEIALRWIRRHRLSAGLIASLLSVATVAFFAVVQQRDVAQQRSIETEEARSNEAEIRLRETVRADETALREAQLAVGRDPTRALEILAGISEAYPHTNAIRTLAADAVGRGLPRRISGHEATIGMIRYAPDGTWLATGGHDHKVQVVDAATLETRWVLEEATSGIVGLEISSDNRHLVTCSDQLRLYDGLTGELMHTLAGHTGGLQDADFSPDGTLVASAGFDATVRIWDAGTGALIRRLDGHQKLLMDVAWDSAGQRIASTGNDGTVKIWDAATGDLVFDQKNRQGVPGYGVAWSPDDEWIAAWGDGNEAYVWDVASQVPLVALPTKADWIYTGAWSPFGRQFVTGGADGELIVWRLEEGGFSSLNAHDGAVTSISFAPNGYDMLTSSLDGDVKVWDIDRLTARTLHGQASPVLQAHFSPDGESVVAGGMGTDAFVWRLEEGDPQVIADIEGGIYGLSFAPDGKKIAIAAQMLHIADLDAGIVHRIRGHKGPVLCVEFDPKGRWLATGGSDDTIRLWPSEGKPIVDASHSGSVFKLLFAPDGNTLASADLDGEVRLMNLETRESTQLAPPGSHVFALAYSEDSSRVSVGSQDQLIHIYNTADPTAAPEEYAGHTSYVVATAYVDGQLISGGADGSVRRWRGGLGEELSGHLLNVVSLEVSGDGRLAAGDSLGAIQLWDPTLSEATALVGHAQYVTAMAWSHDGRMLASTSWDQTARLWPAPADGGPIVSRVLRGHKGDVTDVVFSPDDQRIATAGEDGQLLLWTDDLPHDRAKLRAWLAARAQ